MVSSDARETEESSEPISRSLPVRFMGSASFIREFGGSETSFKKDEADDRSERRLDFPVNEGSELPDDREGDSRERSEAVRLGTGDFIDSLYSEEALETRVSRVLEVI
jgi:hypothetical protein